MKLPPPASAAPPWPIAADAPGAAAALPREHGGQSERAIQLAAARDMLVAALAILDTYARSHAAATVDLAIHLVDTEIGR